MKKVRSSTYGAETLECALCAVGAGLGVEAEGTEAAQVLKLWQAFVVECV